MFRAGVPELLSILLCAVSSKGPAVPVLRSLCSQGSGAVTQLVFTLMPERESLLHTECFRSSPVCLKHCHWTPLSIRAAPPSSSCQLATIKPAFSLRITHTHTHH